MTATFVWDLMARPPKAAGFSSLAQAFFGAEALEQAAGDRRTGAIVLVDEAGRLSGIFTDADFRRLMRIDDKGMSRTISQVMTKHPKHLTTDDLVRDAVALTRERRLDEIPVLDADGKPVGLVDVQDLIAMKVVSE